MLLNKTEIEINAKGDAKTKLNEITSGLNTANNSGGKLGKSFNNLEGIDTSLL